MLKFQSSPIEVQIDDLNLIFGPSLHHVSNDASFLAGQGQLGNSCQENDNEFDSESSYDSTNAFNIF